VETDGLVTKSVTADWSAIRGQYELGAASVRALARAHAISHAAVLKRARVERWTRPDKRDTGGFVQAKAPPWYREAPPRGSVVQPRESTTQPDDDADPAASVCLLGSPGDIETKALIEQGRKLAANMMAELAVGSACEREIVEEIEAFTAADPDGRLRQAMLRQVNLASRATVLRNLATVVRTLAAAGAPAKLGKKEQRQAEAERVVASGKFATARPPTLALVNQAGNPRVKE